MAKLLKISLKALGSVVEWFLILVILFAFLIRTSYVQTYLAQKATDYLSSELQTEVKIDQVAITFFDEVALDGVLIKDQKLDTLISVQTLFASINLIDLKNQTFKLTSALADDAFIRIQRDTNGVMNHEFIREYFVKGPSKGNKIIFDLASAELKNSRFQYDDNRKSKKETFGIDFFHLYASKINGEVSNLSIEKDVVKGDISRISFIERSGFDLEDLRSKVEVSPRGIKLADVTIKTDQSTVVSPSFHMNSDEYPDFKEFVDSVEFDATIARSEVYLSDVAFFSPNLYGMKDHVSISGKLSNRVKDLKISELDLRFKDKTHIQGTINVPDYRKIDREFLHEKLSYAYIDITELETLRLPKSSSIEHIEMDSRIHRLQYFEAHDLRLDGFLNQFVVAADELKTHLGNARFNNGIMITKNDKGYYAFHRSEAEKYDVKLENFNLSALMNDKNLGILDGTFFISGEVRSSKDIRFTEIKGIVDRFDYLDYSYSDIEIQEGTFIDSKFTGLIDIKDDNLDLTYDGFIDLKGDQQMLFTVDLSNAILDQLGLTKKDSKVQSNFVVDLKGKSTKDFNGKVTMNGFLLTSRGRTFSVPHLEMDITRGEFKDIFDITSTVGSLKVEGKVDFNYLIDDFEHQLSRIFPSLYKETKEKQKRRTQDHFTYDITVGEIDDLLAILSPGLHISSGTHLSGNYFGESSNLVMNATSSSIIYNDMELEGISIRQVMDSTTIMANYYAKTFHYNDSTKFSEVYFKGDGTNKHLASSLTWEQKSSTPSALYWVTDIKDIKHYQFKLDPSYFHVKGKRWDILNESMLAIEGDTVSVTDFKLSRNDQFISVNGQMSNQDKHRLLFEVNELDIAEIDWLFTTDHDIQGKINGWGFISNPLYNFYYLGDANIEDLSVDGNEVGDVFVQSSWDNKHESIGMTGDLIYKHAQTFSFSGNYYQNRKEENLDLKLIFDYMDIQFANAFMDPDVMKDIKGLIVGELSLTGEPESPSLDGVVEMKGGSALIDFLGTHFIAEGPIEVDKYGFYINSIPVYDEEGNAGSLVGSVYHDNFRDFNFDLQFDIENDAVNRDPFQPWKPAKLDRFLIMNTPYDPDFAYYGKGFATGEVNIFGYTNNLEITVNIVSQDGTWINIPMYGVGEIDEEQSFLQFKSDLNIQDTIVPLFDLTGVDLDLNMEVTPEAELKIIFNEDTGDEITTSGDGHITMKVDNFGQISMEGTYTVKEGVYDFAMGPVKQKFYLEEGGTMTWTGDVYDADINLRAFYRTYTNIADLSADQFASGSGGHQLILSYLSLQESLLRPKIGFDLVAPQANDISQSLITRVKSDPDELNRQFFSLLLWRKFQPITGTSYSGGSAALDLVSNQINSLLGMVSQDYSMNVNIDQDQLTGDNLYEFGVSKGFLDDRLIVSGSFGVESTSQQNNQGTGSVNQQTLLGDVHIEYVLNEDGTFRVNIFNESTDRTVIYQASDKGAFTQGAGLTYKEDFNSFKDFALIQNVLNVFRKKENRRYTNTRKRNLAPVEAIKEED